MTTLTKKQEKSAKLYKPGLSHTDNIHDLSSRGLKNLDMTLVMAAYGSLTTINLSNNYLLNLPESFPRLMIHIQYLDVSNNQIQKLPGTFGLLRNLHSLILYKNKLETLPVSFGKLENLRWLDVAANPWHPRMKQIFGTDITQGTVVARNVREFFFLLMNAVDTCTEPLEPEAEPNLIRRSSPTKVKDDSRTELYESALDLLREYEELLDVPVAERQDSRPVLASKFLTNSRASLAQVGSQSRGFVNICGIIFALLFGFLSVCATVAWIQGPPKTFLREGNVLYSDGIPPFFTDVLAWLMWCTVYPFRGTIPGVEHILETVFVPSSPSVLKFMFGYK